MVKGNPAKDYYAALEISSAATNADIKKQYHKLALLYHPDRNAGREAEYRPRFQAIQEAYEVLNDADEKVTYDAKRKRGNVNSNTFRRPEPPRRNNPYQATSNFPPPPRRTAVPPTAKRNGAKVYSEWVPSHPPPRKPETSANQDARSREERFAAWQQMNHARPQAQGQRYNVPPPYQGQQRPVPVPPTPMQPAASRTSRQDSSRPPSPPLRSAYEKVNGPAQTFSPRPPRKTGFDPNSPAGGADEGPASGKSQYRVPPDRDPSFGFGFPQNGSAGQATPGTSPTARRPDAFGDSRIRPDDVPFTEGLDKPKTPYPEVIGEKTHYFDGDGLRRTTSVLDHGKLHAQPHAPTQRRSSEHGQFIPLRPPPPPTFDFASSGESSEETPTEQWTNADPSRYGKTHGHRPTAEQMTPDGPMRESKPITPGASVRFTAPSYVKDSMARSSNPELRASNLNRDPMASNNTSKYTDPTVDPNHGRSRSYGNLSNISSEPVYSDDEPDEHDRAQHSADPAASQASEASKDWVPTDWGNAWSHTFAPQNPQQSSPTRGSGNIRKSRGPGSSRVSTRPNSGMPTTPQPTTLEEEEAGNLHMFYTTQGNYEAVDPMDVDTDPPANTSQPSADTSQSQQQARPVVVEPSNPDWREGALNPDLNFNHRRSSLPSFNPAVKYQRPKVETTQQQRLSRTRTVPQTESAFDDMPTAFNHVAPFGVHSPQSPEAVHGREAAFSTMKGDLGSSLPFASTSAPTAYNPISAMPSSVPTDELPKTPKAPPCPSKLTAAYVSEFYAYIAAYHIFLTSALSRLQSITAAQTAFTAPNSTDSVNPRSEAGSLTQPLSSTNIMSHWLTTRGETRDKKGWPTLYALAKQSHLLRRHMDMASERHLVALDAHERLREKEREREAASGRY